MAEDSTPQALRSAQAPDPADGPGPAELIGAVLSALWLVAVGAFFLFVPNGGEGGFDSLRFIVTLMAIFLPVAMIWVAVAASRSARIMREESRRLQAAVEGMRRTYLDDRAKNGAGSNSAVERKLNEIARAAAKTESVLATFTTSRGADVVVPRAAPQRTDAPADTGEQPTLALGTTSEDIAPPLATADLIRALNFPDTDKDEAGFAALRRALKDRAARQVIQASQDVLTLLSQDGIYMDDLRPDRSRPELWRRFAKGERGRAIAALGGVRDRSSLALTAGRMREDTIFRDAAHHFLRKFDQLLVAFEPNASDEEIVAMSETRTARAFMLLGRVTGTFD